MNATAPVQADFCFALFRPLLSVRAAAWLISMSEDHVTRLVEDGTLRGFDLRTEAAGDRFIRVSRYSCERLVIPACRRLPVGFDLSRIFPHSRPLLLRREVQQFFDCSDDHVRRLQSAGLLTGADLSRSGDARGQHIDRESLLSFLTSREIQ